MTLRAAFLLVVVLTGLTVGLLVSVGITGTACLAGLSLLLQAVMRRGSRPHLA